MKQDENPLAKLVKELEILVSVTIIAIGLSLLFDRSYFFFPPNIKDFENDYRLDSIIFIVGLAFFFYLLFGTGKRKVVLFFLIACGAIVLALSAIQLWHFLGAPNQRLASTMAHTLIGDLLLFMLINFCALNS